MSRLAQIGAALLLLAAAAAAPAAEREPLWPAGAMPDAQVAQEAPFLEWHTPTNAPVRDLCVIAVPGGGYQQTSTGGTAANMARRFTARGVTVAILRYRTPRPQGLPKHQSAWEDAQRAIRLVRAQAPARGYSPDRVGMIGFSAGGHLALLCAASATSNAYARVDALDDATARLAFAVPVYPAYVLDRDGRVAPEFLFDALTPPLCLVHGGADTYTALGSVAVYQRLHKMRIPAELHVYAKIPHAFGGDNRKIPEPPLWFDEVWNWLGVMGFIREEAEPPQTTRLERKARKAAPCAPPKSSVSRTRRRAAARVVRRRDCGTAPQGRPLPQAQGGTLRPLRSIPVRPVRWTLNGEGGCAA